MPNDQQSLQKSPYFIKSKMREKYLHLDLFFLIGLNLGQDQNFDPCNFNWYLDTSLATCYHFDLDGD